LPDPLEEAGPKNQIYRPGLYFIFHFSPIAKFGSPASQPRRITPNLVASPELPTYVRFMD
jgi:hypothetical protein